MRKCSLEKLDSVFAEIANSFKLYLPVDDKDGKAKYSEWAEGVKWSNALNTVRSPKDFFFPQTEDLMGFKCSGKNIEIIDTRNESEDFVVFGVRACDVKSFDILDRVFLKDPVDSYYSNRRDHGIIISVACTRPAETCFCILLVLIQQSLPAIFPYGKLIRRYFGRVILKKAQLYWKNWQALTEECDADAVNDQKEKVSAIMKKLPLAGLTADKFGAGKTKELFDAPEWDSLSEACLGCGTCTFICPTCQCYDIKDFNTGKGVVRFRCWDSCMYSEFTKMSAGQPRLTQKERFRQRFMHKLVYYPENNDGLFSCVGCGRCLAKCPISMNIVKVMKTIGGKENE